MRDERRNRVIFDRLSSFTYETRTSSIDFCEALCNISYWKGYNPDGDASLADYIRSRSWFYSDWMFDPTINSMLRMLSGDVDREIYDNIERVFRDCSPVVCNDYFYKCINSLWLPFDVCIINKKEMPDSDDQYIKMNSRGKQLTPFENFKANLAIWMKNSTEEFCEFLPKEFSNKPDEYVGLLASSIDNTWTDVLWKAKKTKETDPNIDDELFAFIHRYVLNELCLEDDIEPNVYDKHKEYNPHDKNEKLKVFSYLYDVNRSEERFSNIYELVLTPKMIVDLNALFCILNEPGVLDNIKKWVGECVLFEEDKFFKQLFAFDEFIEIIVNSGKRKILKINQKDQIYFYSLCRLLLKYGNYPNKNEETTIKQYYRVTRNIVENSDIRGVPEMVSCMRRIKKMFDESMDNNQRLYDYLSGEYDNSIFYESSYLERQWKEECEKAKKINDDSSLEIEITAAENLHVLDGSIRFLYRGMIDDKSRYSSCLNWGEFPAKRDKIRALVDDKLVDDNKRNNEIVNFLSCFTSFLPDLYDPQCISLIQYSKEITKKKKEKHVYNAVELSSSINDKWKYGIFWGALGGEWRDDNKICEAFCRYLLNKGNPSKKQKEYENFLSAMSSNQDFRNDLLKGSNNEYRFTYKEGCLVTSCKDNPTDFSADVKKEFGLKQKGKQNYYLAIHRGTGTDITAVNNRFSQFIKAKKASDPNYRCDYTFYPGCDYIIANRMIEFDHDGKTYGWASDGKVYSKSNNKFKNLEKVSMEVFLASLGY